MLERLTIQKLHRDKCLGILFADVIDGADVGVIQGRRSLRLATEAAEALGIARDFVRQKLQGDETVQARVLGLVNHTHAAAAELLDDAVMRDGLVDHKQMPRLFGLSSYGRGIRESTDLAILDGWSANRNVWSAAW